jgi:hypothetical protein
MTRLVLAISVVPLAIAGLSTLLHHAPPAPSKGDRLAAPAATPVQTIQFFRPEAPAAAQNWLPVSQEAPPLPEPRPFLAGPPAAPQPAAAPARKRRPAGLCARHNLRKVWVSSSQWRCRR